MKDRTNICQYCGNKFTYIRKTQKYCSRECVVESRTIHIYFNCKNCGKEFKYQSNNKNIYCCKKCSREHISKKKRLKELKNKYRNHYRECIDCKAVIRDDKSIRCDKCKKRLAREKWKIYFYSKPRKRRCLNCNIIFNPLKKERFYSTECKVENKRKTQSSTRHKRRARELKDYDKNTNLINIRKRDGNRCLICNKKVLSINISGYHERNATIGHIIPLCKGGAHNMTNVQLECMNCNTKKGIKASGQLRLW